MKAKYALGLVLIALAAPIAVKTLKYRASIATAEASVKKAYVITRTEMVLCNGKFRVTGSRVTARRSDGAWVEIKTGRGRYPQQTRRMTFPTGLVGRVNDTAQLKSTRKAQPFEVTLSELDPASDCISSFDGGATIGATVVGHEELYGFQTVKILQSRDGFRLTQWRAPDLNCELVKHTMEFANAKGQPLRLNDTLATDSITVEEPPAWMFDTAGYRELKPSDFSIETQKHNAAFYGKQVPDSTVKQIREDYRENDARYAATRP